jgi:hypothetical protein
MLLEYAELHSEFLINKSLGSVTDERQQYTDPELLVLYVL